MKRVMVADSAGMGWDGMGWDGMGWDDMGDGMGDARTLISSALDASQAARRPRAEGGSCGESSIAPNERSPAPASGVAGAREQTQGFKK